AYLSWLGPRGLEEVGELCLGLAEHAKSRLDLPLLFAEQATFKEFAVRVGRNAEEVVREARAQGVHPGYPLRRDYPDMHEALVGCGTGKRTAGEIDRLAEVVGRGAGPGGRGRSSTRSRDRVVGRPRSPARTSRRRPSPSGSAVPGRRACPRSPSQSSSGTSRRSPTGTSGSTPASTRSAPAR